MPLLKDRIREQARDLGFVACGFATADGHDAQGADLMRFLGEGRHGTMDWLEARAHQRIAPTALWPEARSVIALGMSYAPDSDPLALAAAPSAGRISVYAQGGDYHKTVKKRLKALARWLVETEGGELKVFVDTAPVMEKPLAAAAGIGWPGKHTNLVSRDHGSWLFLGIILTSLDIPPDDPARDTCGTCTRCLAACPTDAFDGPRRIDARKCISYLTIEHDGPIPEQFRRAIGNRIYGCDDCLAVCPWNRFADAAAANRAFLPREELKAPRLTDLLALDDAAFRARFAGSPIKRIGVKRMIRNCLVAAGNSGDATLIPAVRAHLGDDDPVVGDAARWALAELQGASSEPTHSA
ncbi:tRNA epoxyqueuosine(34) reductase QueG [Sphingomonas sabuli]|uniref:Epoxyqueuosine reductase n=1 Tax=Sphingomonas sabuli TaxID=2764186 RepID=A0A7G9KZE7_9SPHN|nr:tRNA epoxyqueuosine(34) reductase QueG [Sphingomonas sabuli]QNM81746.1 tRNA epoxyqueuosine(34) reductase QueG [Sphingomonas sabuli]